ncbi:MAG: hypothetical protein LCH87_00450 [Actinobacteria bacterium]|nr:hypothetical protein [Actinomycetota bacterium]
MRYLVRIGGMIIGVIAGSAVLATVLSQFMAQAGILADVGAGGVFVGLTTMGLMGAILTREAWLAV